MLKCLIFLACLSFSISAADSPLAIWQSGVNVHPVAEGKDRHTIHAYFNLCPESPDGKYVLFYTSSTQEGNLGELRVVERATGTETLIAQNINTEDAHRAACQQWSNGGKTVVYHDNRNGVWTVVAVDFATKTEKILATNMQLGMGSPIQKTAPLYGCHWNPGETRDFYLVDVETGERKTAFTIDEIKAGCSEWMAKTFGDKQTSVFFPVMSQDGKRVFVKIAAGRGGNDFKGMDASFRTGKAVIDLENRKFIRLIESWGHPSWHPDSRRIFEKGNFLFNPETGKNEQFVKTPSDHPSIAPDGTMFVSDADVSKRPFGGAGMWVIVVGSTTSDEQVNVHLFNNTKGATSWRRNHPHPSFSADGKRIYFNVNDGPWTRLFVAESGGSAVK